MAAICGSSILLRTFKIFAIDPELQNSITIYLDYNNVSLAPIHQQQIQIPNQREKEKEE